MSNGIERFKDVCAYVVIAIAAIAAFATVLTTIHTLVDLLPVQLGALLFSVVLFLGVSK